MDELLGSESKARVESKSPEKLKNRPLRWIIAAVLLLGAIVQVSLDLATFRVGRLDDPGPGCAHLFELGPHLGCERARGSASRSGSRRSVHR